MCLRLAHFFQLSFMQHGTACIQLICLFIHFSYDDCGNTCTWSYHHQIESITLFPLFRVKSWNNGTRCMSFYILIRRLMRVADAIICIYIYTHIYIYIYIYHTYWLIICFFALWLYHSPCGVHVIFFWVASCTETIEWLVSTWRSPEDYGQHWSILNTIKHTKSTNRVHNIWGILYSGQSRYDLGQCLLPDTHNCGLRMHRECRGCFPATAGYRSWHVSRHVRHARAVMHAGITN